jgi:hypothetical protein
MKLRAIRSRFRLMHRRQNEVEQNTLRILLAVLYADFPGDSSSSPRIRGLRVIWAFGGVFRASHPADPQDHPPHYRMSYPPWTLDPSCNHEKEVKIAVLKIEKRKPLQAAALCLTYYATFVAVPTFAALEQRQRETIFKRCIRICSAVSLSRETLRSGVTVRFLGISPKYPDRLRFPGPRSHGIRAAWNAVMQPQLSISAQQRIRRRVEWHRWIGHFVSRVLYSSARSRCN